MIQPCHPALHLDQVVAQLQLTLGGQELLHSWLLHSATSHCYFSSSLDGLGECQYLKLLHDLSILLYQNEKKEKGRANLKLIIFVKQDSFGRVQKKAQKYGL